MVTTRLRIGGQPREFRGDVLSQLSFLLAMSFALASIVFFGARLGLHYGLLRAQAETRRPVAAKSSAPAVPSVDLVAAAELPSPDPAQPVTLGVLASPGSHPNSVYLPILMYHYVRVAAPGDKLGFGLSVTPDNFAAQMAWLSAHGYTPVTMRDAVLMIEKQRPSPEKPIALTFDDAYADFYTAAVPILQRYGFTATSYVPTRLVGLPDYLTWDQVVELDQQGFEMAAHTEFHVGLGRANLARARTEISGSMADLESHLGHPVTDFCYPYGSFDPQVVQLVKQSGFLSATTTLDGTWHDQSQMFTLTRVRVGGAETLDAWSRTFAPTDHGWPTVSSFGAASPPPAAARRTGVASGSEAVTPSPSPG